MKKGFTLIELLVVVLIIGILAAVALPQYEVAVGKARFVQVMTLARQLHRAEQVYFLANGKYTDQLADLDIDMPAGGKVGANGDSVGYKNFSCSLLYKGGYQELNCWPEQEGVPIFVMSFTHNVAYCRGYNKRTQKVCLALGGTNPVTDAGEGYTQYVLL